LQVGDHVAQLLEVLALKQRLALDHHQHVELGRGEALGDFLVLLVFDRVGTEQLAERIVDLDPLDAERRADAQQREDDARQHRRANADQPDPLQPECNARQLPARLVGVEIASIHIVHVVSVLGRRSGARLHRR